MSDLIEQEIRFQKIPRPNRSKENDAHESMIREYILGDKLTCSDEFKKVLTQLRALIISAPDTCDDDEGFSGQLDELVARWEDHHPGQRFYS